MTPMTHSTVRTHSTPSPHTHIHMCKALHAHRHTELYCNRHQHCACTAHMHTLNTALFSAPMPYLTWWEWWGLTKLLEYPHQVSFWECVHEVGGGGGVDIRLEVKGMVKYRVHTQAHTNSLSHAHRRTLTLSHTHTGAH